MPRDPYRHTAAWYDTLFERTNRGLRLLGLRMLRPRAGMTVLDVGCGTGVHLELYQRFRCDVHGIDPSPAMMAVARQRLGDSAALHLGDACAMPYGDRSFDLVVCMLTLHEMGPTARSSAMEEMKRVVRDQGHLLLIDYHPGPIRGLPGWRTKAIILLSEVAAGCKHFFHYRHFLRNQALPALVAQHGLRVEKERIVGQGALALLLVRAG
jgi:ubiquinone/menaquinone biosynthesis C-methylase UbiE